MLKGIGALFLLIVLIVAIASQGGSGKSDSPPDAAASETQDATGDNMDGRSRYFVNQIRRCMKDVNLLGQVMQGGLNDVQLATAVRGTQNVCDAANEKMALADTTHFSDQALDAQVALNEFRDGLTDVSAYIDTLAPSKAANARSHFDQGRAWMGQALDAINARRAIYGAPALG